MRSPMRFLATALLLAGCSRGAAPPVAGTWAENIATFPGSGVKMTLLSDGVSISGTGNVSRDPAADSDFTVTGKIGTPAAGQLVFHYTDGTSEDFTYAQPDEDHLGLTSATSARRLFREE